MARNSTRSWWHSRLAVPQGDSKVLVNTKAPESTIFDKDALKDKNSVMALSFVLVSSKAKTIQKRVSWAVSPIIQRGFNELGHSTADWQEFFTLLKQGFFVDALRDLLSLKNKDGKWWEISTFTIFPLQNVSQLLKLISQSFHVKVFFS